MKVLLIGGTGILSTGVCKEALDRGIKIVTVNRGHRKEFLDNRACNIEADVRNEEVELLKKKINITNYDVVVDFISYTPQQLKKTIEVIKDNCKQFIFISSATVYQEVEGEHEYIESDDIHNDKWQYCQQKTLCEELLNNNIWQFQYTIVRPYITYGQTRIPFQICSLKYYSLLNRIKNNKPVIMVDNDIKCTLTNVKDFSVAMVDLFMNPNAYGEAFHITSNYRYKWEDVFLIIEKNIDESTLLLKLSMGFLESIKDVGFDIAELKGDKARNMIFNNNKIKNVCRNYNGNISLEEGIKESILYYANPEHQLVDYIWEGKIDRIVNKYFKVNNINRKCSMSNNKEKISLTNKLKYLVGNNEFLYVIAKIIKGKK